LLNGPRWREEFHPWETPAQLTVALLTHVRVFIPMRTSFLAVGSR
jgi:hypothetical protein